MINYTEQLPKEVLHILQAARNEQPFLKELIGQGGYVPPNEDLIVDAITVLGMGKNLLLTGPTGSGKTKLAETLSYLFQQPMYSINCSVDLDAESLMGFKTLEYENKKKKINFILVQVLKARKKGPFYNINKFIMQNLKN